MNAQAVSAGNGAATATLAPAATLLGAGGTYPGHGLARDCYLGSTDDEVQWGPHHNWELRAPAAGTVTLYRFTTPLKTLNATSDEYQKAYRALFRKWVCISPWPAGGRPQIMNVVVFVPDAPLPSPGGPPLRALWFGHVRDDVRTGRVARGDLFALSGASGIQFEKVGIAKARAAHVHTCASATGALSPNGDVDGFVAAKAMGWDVVNVGTVPGPNEYLSGYFCAGRLLRDFQWAHKPIPPRAPA